MSEDTFENPSEKSLNPEALLRGLDEESKKRFLFRLTHIEKLFEERKTILKNGNLAKLEPEIFSVAGICQDFIDVFREFITLINFRQEQGLISPPSLEASKAETATEPDDRS